MTLELLIILIMVLVIDSIFGYITIGLVLAEFKGVYLPLIKCIFIDDYEEKR